MSAKCVNCTVLLITDLLDVRKTSKSHVRNMMMMIVMIVIIIIIIIITFFVTIVEKPLQSTCTIEHKEPAPARRSSHNET